MISMAERLKRLYAYNFGFLRERYSDEHPEYAGDFDEAAAELRRFLTLPLYENGPIAAMSHKVDKLWHLFITHTPQYAEFCESIYDGALLHHQPRSEQYSVPVEAISNFYLSYPNHFGAVPRIWFEDIPPAHVVAVRNGQVPDAVQQLKWSGWPGW